MKILLAGTSFLPAYGGPAVSVSGLAGALSDVGVQVGLWAPDQSAISAPLLSVDKPVLRLAGSESDAFDALRGADILHDNGIWLPHNHRLAKIAEKRGIPRIVSTRGMLEPWAMNHKRWKKYLAWQLYQRRDLMKAHCHHATAEPEAENIRRLKLGVPIRIIPNGVDIPELNRGTSGKKSEATGESGGQKIALFLGRIHPVKGLPMLVDAWAQVRPRGWQLQIAGPDEAGFRVEVDKAVAAAGLRDVISFSGHLDGEAKQSAYFNADLFVLPTHAESFGVVVAEALAHGLPVLTTTGAPWPLLAERGCGWWVEPTVEGLAKGLRQATSLDRDQLAAQGARGREWVAQEFGWDRVARQFVTAYEDVLRKKNHSL